MHAQQLQCGAPRSLVQLIPAQMAEQGHKPFCTDVFWRNQQLIAGSSQQLNVVAERKGYTNAKTHLWFRLEKDIIPMKMGNKWQNDTPNTTIKIRKGGSFKSGWEGGDIHQSSLVCKWKPQISHSSHGNRKFKKRHAVSLWLSAPTGKQPIKDGDNKFMWKRLVLKVSIWKHRRHRIVVQHAKSDLVSFKIKIVYTINVHVIHWILNVLFVCSHLKEKRPQLPKLLPRNTSMKHGSLKSLLKSRRSEEVALSRQSISSIIPQSKPILKRIFHGSFPKMWRTPGDQASLTIKLQKTLQNLIPQI